MQRLKRILIATGIFLLVMLVIGFLLPNGWQVERSVVIRAPAAAIFPHINNLKNWRAWVVWYEQHPDLVTEYSGPDSGVGATSRWRDEDGRKALKIMQSEKNHRVDYQVLLNAGISRMDGSLILLPEGTATRVLWETTGQSGYNLANRYVAFFQRYKIGSDFDASLQRLQHKIESKN